MKGVFSTVVLIVSLLANRADGSSIPEIPFQPPKTDNSAPAERLAVSVSNLFPEQGDPVLVTADLVAPADNAVLLWKDRSFPMKKAGPGQYIALVGVDLEDPPGKAVFSVIASGGGASLRADLELTVGERQFPVQELTLPKRMAEFDEKTLARIRGEAERLNRLFAAVSPPAWELPFAAPVADFRPTNFGVRRVINGEPRSRHAAVDIHVPEGVPVAAATAGTVAFAGEQFFGGRSVVLDHGGGLFSLYYHLLEFRVAEGQHVLKGEKIGTVGSSGRATGPHLHFGVRAGGSRVDPARLFGEAFR